MQFCFKRPTHAAFTSALVIAFVLGAVGVASAQPDETDADEQGLENEVGTELDDGDDATGDTGDTATGDAATGDAAAGDTATGGAPVADPTSPDAEPEAPRAEPLAGWKKDFYLESPDGNYKLVPQARVQGRWEFDSEKSGDDRVTGSEFLISRARLTLKGHVFDKGVGYKFQTDFGKGGASLKDFYVDYKLGGPAIVRVGQYKRPFSRQQITSSGSQEFVDRAITDKAFDGSRDIGVMVHNNFEKSPDFEWAVGVFNGTGDNERVDLQGPAVVLRAGINRGGLEGYSEADLEGGPLRFGVAASVLADYGAGGARNAIIRGQLDFIVKVNGLAATGGVYLSTKDKVDAEDPSLGDQEYDGLGFHGQIGYTIDKKHQVAARFAQILPGDTAVTELPEQQEILLGYSLYAHKHGLKWQTDVGVITDGGGDIGDLIAARSQLQLSF